MLGKFLSCLKGVKDTLGVQVGRWDSSPDTAVEKVISSRGSLILLGFLELQRGCFRVRTGTSGIYLWGLKEVQSPRES